ncbi:MAG: sensor histidine kinase, partial [Candidatus Binatia bacterium]
AWDYPPDLPVIKTDRGKLKQILQNLINNAIKFTGKGRVAISARRLPSRASVEFKVAETGGGISHEALPLIFDMFGQINSPDMKVYGSIGLGLHIVKSFTELLGGKVELESGPDRGSTFTVTIPLEKT